MLDHHVVNPTLAWDKSTISGLKESGYFNPVVQLSKDAVDELHEIYAKTSEYDPNMDHETFVLGSLSDEVERIRKNHLEQGLGFVILDNFWNSDYSIEQGKNGLLVLSQLLGKVIPQNATGLLVKEVRDRSKSYDSDSTSRYSDSRYGGDYHTDGAEIPPPLPEFLPLLSIRRAETGGVFKVISAYSIHNALLEKDPEALERLYGNFHWDRRGDLGPNGEETFEKPIFKYQNGTLTCEYLRRYIDEGYEKAGVIQTGEDITALDSMDSLLYDDSLAYNLLMKPGQLMISVNSRTLHGRDGFEDFITEDGIIDKERQRILLRTWVLNE